MAETRTSTGIKALLPLYTVIFIGFVGYSLMITVFTPLILYGHMGIIPSEMPPSHRPILLGVLVSLYPLGQFFGSPVAGALSDRFGRKPTLLVSLIITTACYALLAIALANGRLALLMAASLLAGLAEANIVIAQSAIADVATDQARNRLFGYIYLSVSLAYIAGPLIGGKLADPSLVPWFTYATPFWAVFGLLLVTFLWTALLFRETRAAPVGEPIRYAAAFTNLLNVFTDRRLQGNQLFVFVQPADHSGRLDRRAVTLGHQRGGKAEIVAGLAPGETYVAKGAILLLNAIELARE